MTIVWKFENSIVWLEQNSCATRIRFNASRFKSFLHRTRCQEQVRPSLPSLSHYNCRLPILYICPHCHPSPSTTAAFLSILYIASASNPLLSPLTFFLSVHLSLSSAPPPPYDNP